MDSADTALKKLVTNNGYLANLKKIELASIILKFYDKFLNPNKNSNSKPVLIEIWDCK